MPTFGGGGGGCCCVHCLPFPDRLSIGGQAKLAIGLTVHNLGIFIFSALFPCMIGGILADFSGVTRCHFFFARALAKTPLHLSVAYR